MNDSITDIKAFDKNCIGCQNHKKEIMISFRTEGKPDFNDIFLSEEQAKNLVLSIEKSLKINSEPEVA